MKVIFSVLFAVDTDVFIRGKNVQELCIALNDIIRQPPIRTWSALSTLSHGKNRCIARSSAIILFIWWWWWRLWWRGINNMKLNGANICIFFSTYTASTDIGHFALYIIERQQFYHFPWIVLIWHKRQYLLLNLIQMSPRFFRFWFCYYRKHRFYRHSLDAVYTHFLCAPA